MCVNLNHHVGSKVNITEQETGDDVYTSRVHSWDQISEIWLASIRVY